MSTSRLSLVPSGDLLLVLLGAVVLVAVLVAVAPIRRLLRSRSEPLVRQSLP